MTTITYQLLKKGYASLSVRDCQLFFKRLRKIQASQSFSNLSQRTIKYYLAGEYGGKGGRPHYHIILFNADTRFIERAWKLGAIHYGDSARGVTEASIGYCLKYISKKTFVHKHNNDDRRREFGLQSKGIGSSYLTKAMRAWHTADLENRMYVNIEGGKKATMARYYKNKLYTDAQKLQIGSTLAVKMAEQAYVPIEKWRDDAAAKKAATQLENKKLKQKNRL